MKEAAERLRERMYSIVNGAVWAAIPKWAYAVVIAVFGIAVGLGIFERVSYDADGIRNMMLREEAMMVGGNPEDVSLDWNAVGACIRYYFDNRRNIQFRLWECSESHLGIPDMTLIVINISFRGPADTVHSEMTAFVHWLQQTAKINGFLHFADENRCPLSADQVPGCSIACCRL
ncbi:hypothetical protein [Barnesiella sp. CU968]|uniref:hypothetical protein n=1 Tax=Barnesiella sp. CU968 TaxID=2780099 RepID=UPI00195D5DDF|nr:hypothetical protein [Barnesiella sp. CU968]MBJ2197851.1 hypothetical protein [Muribaculaceae bacterium]MCI9029888.1 hypothetical protein [Muribaculaceae bacterium]